MTKYLIYTFLSLVTLFLLTACKDRYQEGYQNGYADGVASIEQTLNKACEDKLSECKERSSRSYFGSTSTEVCGGGGVNLNGKHYSGGKTGCVRVHSDGRVERY